jgi:hypothetical protein
MIRISEGINKCAKAQMSLDPANSRKEAGIVLLAIVKLITMIFSAYAANSFFNNIVSRVLDHHQLRRIVTIIILVLLEALAAYTLSDFFKNLFRRKIKSFLLSLVFVSFFYSVSFISSTNGLAQQQSAKINLSDTIGAKWQRQLDALNLQEARQLQEINNYIVSIQNNPIAWSNGKRNLLSNEQQRSIKEYAEQKSGLRKTFEIKRTQLKVDYQNKLNKNMKLMESTKEQYYTYMATNMLIQLLVTGFMSYLFYLVYMQNRHEIIKEEEEILRSQTYDQARILVAQIFKEVFNDFFSQGKIKTSFALDGYKNINAPINTCTKKDSRHKHINESAKLSEDLVQKEEVERHKRYCLKHQLIVDAIRNTIDTDKDFLTQEDINNKIMPNLKNTRYKSASLIRKVYKSIKLTNDINKK